MCQRNDAREIVQVKIFQNFLCVTLPNLPRVSIQPEFRLFGWLDPAGRGTERFE